MPLKDGDIVTLDYEGRTEGILFDTTLEKVAKKENGTRKHSHSKGLRQGTATFTIPCAIPFFPLKSHRKQRSTTITAIPTTTIEAANTAKKVTAASKIILITDSII